VGEPPDNVLPFPTSGPHLEQTLDDGKRCITPLSDRIRIGRSRENDLRLKDSQVSSLHCSIERRGEGFVVIDNASSNGVQVNGVQIHGQDVAAEQLHEGDVLSIGRSRLVVRLGPLAERWPPRPPLRAYRPSPHGDECVVMGQSTLQRVLTDADREAMRVAERAATVRPVGADPSLEAVRERNARWNKCRKLCARLASGADVEKTALKLANAVGQVLPVDAAVVFLADTRGELQRRAEAERVQTPAEVPVNMSVVNRARNTGQVVTTVQNGALLLAVPLGNDSATRGVLYAAAGKMGTLEDDDLRMLFQLSAAAELGFGFRS
jgi:pSer/pThr/pTyr-binding forkhead associated (FHA) protein